MKPYRAETVLSLDWAVFHLYLYNKHRYAQNGTVMLTLGILLNVIYFVPSLKEIHVHGLFFGN